MNPEQIQPAIVFKNPPRVRAMLISVGLVFSAFVAVVPLQGRTDSPTSYSEMPTAFVIRLNGNQLTVEANDGDLVEAGPKNSAIVIYSFNGVDQWQLIRDGETWNRPVPADEAWEPKSLAANTRGIQAGGGGILSGRMTNQLDQLVGQVVVRGKSFITPANGFVLNGRITIRRPIPEGKNNSVLPPAVAVMSQGNKKVASITLPAGKQTIQYREMGKLAERFPDGLPAGEYQLRNEDGGESSSFTVEETQWRDQVLQIPKRLAKALGNTTDPVYLQVAVETLLDQYDEHEKPLAYFSDALDVLESIPEQELNPYLKKVRQSVLDQLAGNSGTPLINAETESTGIGRIDDARSLIRMGNWQAALDSLSLIREGSDQPRALALANLYRAVILSESGLGAETEAMQTFHSAIQQIQNDSPEDLFRAHNNYGSFLLNNTQDRLYNHAFQISTGARSPIVAALSAWVNARREFDIAAELASADVARLSGIQVNQSRLFALLSDLIQTIDVPVENEKQLVEFENAASEQAIAFAKKAGASIAASGNDPMVLASVEEVQSQIAFRRRLSQPCLEHATRALRAYSGAGSIAGVEGVHRLLGLHFMNLDDGERSRQEALRHFTVSNALADFLRERIPSDKIGLSQAGFFARRAYVNEKIIELLILENKPIEALRYAELAKARSLQDLLTMERSQTESVEFDARTIDEILADWPREAAAVEYFIGTEKVWLFLIDTQGSVSVYDLMGDKGKSRDFISQVTRFLEGMTHYAPKLKMALLSGRGFDHQWQYQLHDYFNLMMPGQVLAELQKADTVVVVPHHVLHYFPFAALVTHCDPRKRDSLEMVQPEFLIDESFSLVHAPSLGIWDRLRSAPARQMKSVNAVGIVDFPGAQQLPGVETDMQNLNAAFGKRVKRTLFGSQATEGSVRSLLTEDGMLLFATHGQNLADDPLSSYLLVLRDAEHDGRLTAKDLFACKINSDLIVMSACYTGLADRSPMPGDDLFGIQRALLQSGARSVVSGLWDVYDGTAPVLMNGVFDHLANGQSVPKALAQSQRDFLKRHRSTDSDPWLHPYFWAVYSVAGDDRTAFAPN